CRHEAASEVLPADIHGGFPAEAVEVRLEPGVGALAADVAKVHHESPVAVELAGDAELTHLVLGRDAVNMQASQIVAAHFAFVDETGDEADRPHLPHQR